MGLIGTRRLMEHFSITSTPIRHVVECGKPLSRTAPPFTASNAKSMAQQMANGSRADPFDEVERQNQELLKTLAELKEKQEQLADLNRELEDTNRGVVALYAELDQHADDLRRVSDLKTSFLSNLSHEFRTPLNSIGSLSNLLLGRFDGNLSPEQEKQVTYIQRSAAELSELVNDLLDLAKVEAGKIDVKPRHFEVQEFLGALRGMLKPLLAGNSLDLIFEAAPGIPTLYMDEGKISQVLRNLISNALKFTRKGYIRVTAAQEQDGWIVFRVADTGIGIAPEDQETDLRRVRTNRRGDAKPGQRHRVGTALIEKVDGTFGRHTFGGKYPGKRFDVHGSRTCAGWRSRARAAPSAIPGRNRCRARFCSSKITGRPALYIRWP